MTTPFSTFEELEDFFSRLASPGIRPGLERIATLLKRLGCPETVFPSIHIVGTNGKGSTAAFTERILRESGYSTALYTSPHLESPAERLQVNGAHLPLDEWSRCAREVEEALKADPRLVQDPPTFFEIVTAVAFLLCQSRKVDVAVVEAGLGGRLDATNLLGNVVLTLITSISMDHMEFLGNSLEQIASEKFAVMRKNVPAVFSGTPSKLLPLFRETALSYGAFPYVSSEVCLADEIQLLPNGLSYSCRTALEPAAVFSDKEPRKQNIAVHSALQGVHQVENSSLAIAGALLLAPVFPRVTTETIQKGISLARWPGRFEIIHENPVLILDGGHNPDGVEKLVETLSLLYGERRIGVVYGCMKDKAFTECISLLRRVCSKLYCTSVPDNSRSASPELLSDTAKTIGWRPEEIVSCDDPLEAIRIASSSEEVVLCCGSLYLVGYVRKHLALQTGEREDNDS
jgi:dihydrofolate synthase/folylpolyglutamate synthase